MHLRISMIKKGGWLSGTVLDSSPRGRGFEPHQRHYEVSLSKNINPSLVLVQPRKTHPFITERLLMGCKESNQTNKQNDKKRYCLVTKTGNYEYTYLIKILCIRSDVLTQGDSTIN